MAVNIENELKSRHKVALGRAKEALLEADAYLRDAKDLEGFLRAKSIHLEHTSEEIVVQYSPKLDLT